MSPDGVRPDLAESLLPLAISAPATALERAVLVIAGSGDPRELSVAHQAAAIVHRDRGQVADAVGHAFAALRQARRVDPERQADVLATLGVVLAYAGRTAEALRRFEEAVPLTPPAALPRLHLRRAHVYAMLARHDEAIDDLTRAIGGSHWTGDTLWEARALNNRFDVLLAQGDTEGAEADAVRAEQLFADLGQDWEVAQSLHNRALAAHQRGDLPEALTLLDEATDRYVALGNVRHDLAIDKVQTLLTAGLTTEARDLGASTLARPDLAPVRRAELLLVSARAALALGELSDAEAMADEAARLFADQLRHGWQDRALLLRLRARYVADHPESGPWMLDEAAPPDRSPGEQARRTERLLDDASALVDSMRAGGAAELPVALVLHGRICADAGREAAATASLEEAAATRFAGAPLSRAAGWLAAALLATHRGDRRGLHLACRRGLDAVDEHRQTLGDVELRALASGHGVEFTRLAVSEAVRSGRPRQLLWWAERWRAAAFGVAPAPTDPGLRRDLAALRDVMRRLDALDALDDGPDGADGADGADGEMLGRERSRLEASIRRAHRHQRSDAPGGRTESGLDLASVLAELGDDGLLLNLVNDRDTLHVLAVCRGRVRHRVVGPTAAAVREADFARFTLRRAAYGRPVDLSRAARLLRTALLGTQPLGGPEPRRVVVVPPADLLTAPWGLVPDFHDVVLTVSPSVSQWLRARRRSTPGSPPGATARADHVALVTGPGLTTKEAEVAGLSRIHRHARVLHADEATVAAAMSAVEGASLAHIAAHGVFRADAPLFSSLRLADGPLTVHDLRTLRHPPRSFVLSACDSGGAAPIGPYEALGLVANLLGMGTSTVLASVVPVNDLGCLAVMADVHTVAGRTGSVAEGWLAARTAAQGDVLRMATASSFTAWGA